MPKIPTLQANTELRVGNISPDVMAEPFRATAAAGQEMQRSAAVALRNIEISDEIERKADLGLKALRIEHGLKDDTDAIAESYYGRTDYENFDEDLKKNIETVRSKYQPVVGESKELNVSFERALGNQGLLLKKLVRDKRRSVITEQAIGEFDWAYNQSIMEYSKEPNEGFREEYKTNIKSMAEDLVNRRILTPKQAETAINKFDETVDEYSAREAIIINPEFALKTLMDPKKYPNLDPGRRLTLFEHAQAGMKQEEVRMEKLTHAIQRDNASLALVDYANGTLDITKLKNYQMRDQETQQPGLENSFFTSMLEKLKAGKDVVSDPDVFNRLYVKDKLKSEDVIAESRNLSTHDQRTLLSRVLQERREDERDARQLRREAITERKAEEREMVAAQKHDERLKKEEKTQIEREGKERRNRYARDARSYLLKAMGEMGTKSDDGMEMFKQLQGYISDKKVEAEDLPDIAKKIVESKRGGVIKWIKNMLYPDTKTEINPWEKMTETATSEETEEKIETRKPLKDIFGTK
jgi:hypothetical protein